MRKKIVAVIISALMLVACVPFFSGCSASVNYVLNDDQTYYIAKCTGYKSALKGELIIPEEYNGLPVKEVAQEGFRGAGISKLTIPASIESMGLAAFANCKSLTEVVFESGSHLSEVPQGTFGYCSSLSTVTLPSAAEKIGVLAFVGCESLKNITLPDTVKQIGYEAFAQCAALTSINLPVGLETIGILAFYGTGLTEVIVPSTVKDKQVPAVDENGDPKTDESGAPVINTVYGIGIGAFYLCESLEKAAIMDGAQISGICADVFGDCSKLEEVYLPSTITKIEGHIIRSGSLYAGHAFRGCEMLTTVYFAGTQEQWKGITIENTSYTENRITINNNAIINVPNKVFNTAYAPQA